MFELILVADDDATTRKFVIASLERENFIVFPASSGTEALAVCKKIIDIDLLLTDVRMGGLTGIKLAERILKERPGTRVLVMSGSPEAASGAAEKHLPFLRKPFTHDELIARVRQVLSDSG